MKISLQKVIRIVSLIVFIACTAVLSVYIIGDIRDSESNKNVDKLKDAEVTVPDVLDEYAGLYAENSDTIGWLKIDGTELDNVVMFSRHDNEKYLHTDFYGNSSYRGCLFVDGWCDVLTSDNIIVCGHHMKDGSMFGVIVDYQSDEFYKQHKYISFDTIYEKQTYGSSPQYRPNCRPMARRASGTTNTPAATKRPLPNMLSLLTKTSYTTPEFG